MTTILTKRQEEALTLLTEFMKAYTSQPNLGSKLPTLTWVQEFKEVPIPLSDVPASHVETTWVENGAWTSTGFDFDCESINVIDFVLDALADTDDAAYKLFDNNILENQRTRETLTLEHATQLIANAIDVNCYDGVLSSRASVHVPILTNPHFTTAACKKFIESNKHNLHSNRDGECRTVLDYVYRNREIEELFKALAILTGIPLESTYNEPRKVNKEFTNKLLGVPFEEGE